MIQSVIPYTILSKGFQTVTVLSIAALLVLLGTAVTMLIIVLNEHKQDN